MFIGRLKNEAAEAVCDVKVFVVFDGIQKIGPVQIDGLSPGGRQDFKLVAGGATFSDWIVEVESFICSSAGDGEGSEGGGSGAESGEESSPSIPLMETFSGVFNNLNFTFAFDESTSAFRGFVENQTSQLVCQSRVEVHIAVGSQVIELGPTIGVDLAPSEIIDVVLQPNDFAIDSYTLHPESSPCPVTGGQGSVGKARAAMKAAKAQGGEYGSEESGTMLALNETYDEVRNGARLILDYDVQSNSIQGLVENTTGNTLIQVRVEVHLSDGIELGPTNPVDLAPGELFDVTLPATSQGFDRWTPHVEVGTGTGEGGGEGGGSEHGGGREGSGG